MDDGWVEWGFISSVKKEIKIGFTARQMGALTGMTGGRR